MELALLGVMAYLVVGFLCTVLFRLRDLHDIADVSWMVFLVWPLWLVVITVLGIGDTAGAVAERIRKRRKV